MTKLSWGPSERKEKSQEKKKKKERKTQKRKKKVIRNPYIVLTDWSVSQLVSVDDGAKQFSDSKRQSLLNVIDKILQPTPLTFA